VGPQRWRRLTGCSLAGISRTRWRTFLSTSTTLVLVITCLGTTRSTTKEYWVWGVTHWLAIVNTSLRRAQDAAYGGYWPTVGGGR